MRNDKIIDIDFQGWPVYALTLKEILQELGAVEKDGVLGFDINDIRLSLIPNVYDDDGMAYGVNKRYISEVDTFEDETHFVNIFTSHEAKDINARLDA